MSKKQPHKAKKTQGTPKPATMPTESTPSKDPKLDNNDPINSAPETIATSSAKDNPTLDNALANAPKVLSPFTTSTNNTKERSLSALFAIVILILLAFFGWKTSIEQTTLKQSLKEISEQNEQHLIKTDSIFLSNFLLLNNLTHDSTANKNIQQEINNFYKTDSVMLEHERAIALKQQNNLLETHLRTIDSNYANITLWGAVLSILFIVFSFFSIYKIEDTKKQMENLLDQLNKEEIDLKNRITTDENQFKAAKQEALREIGNGKESLGQIKTDCIKEVNQAKVTMVALLQKPEEIGEKLEGVNSNLQERKKEIDELLEKMNTTYKKLCKSENQDNSSIQNTGSDVVDASGAQTKLDNKRRKILKNTNLNENNRLTKQK